MMKIIVLHAILILIVSLAHGQELASTGQSLAAAISLSDAPVPGSPLGAQSSANGTQSSSITLVTTAPQTKGVRGFSNLRSVSADEILSRQTAQEKFKAGLQDGFSCYSLILIGVSAGIHQGSNEDPAFRQGAAGYGRYYWHAFADQADENLWVISIIPAALHEDSRYYRLGRGGFLKRTSYALSRAVITRNDDGGRMLNVAELVGSGAAAGISTAYYPGQYRTWTKTGQRWLSNALLDSATFAAKEFWPDVYHSIFAIVNEDGCLAGSKDSADLQTFVDGLVPNVQETHG
ncbi:MAG TPA: hypothetical protein VGD64_15705 [Acidisarcina sp.]